MPGHRQKIKATFNEFNGQNLQRLDSFYSNQIEFHDPVKKISGLDNLKSYYSHMYTQVESIQFEFHRFIENEDEVSCEWTMKLAVRNLNFGKPYTVQGASFFNFDQKGLVSHHRDYFDVSEMVYENIPILGKAVKFIKSKL